MNSHNHVLSETKAAITKCKGDMSTLAELLDMTRGGVWARLKKLDLVDEFLELKIKERETKETFTRVNHDHWRMGEEGLE